MGFRIQNPLGLGLGKVLTALSAAALLALAHTYAAGPQQPTSPSEISSRETSPSFKLQVERNLVVVRAVVRDANGRVIGDLRREDFRVSDNGKPQIISHFSMESPRSKATVPEARPTKEAVLEEEQEEPPAGSIGERYLALFFDDVHSQIDDLMRSRMAAEKYLANALQPGDRVGMFTSSGEHQLDFTSDLGKLREKLRGLLPRTVVSRLERNCPEISDYQAFMIVERHDPYATQIAQEEAQECNPLVTTLGANVPTQQLLMTVDSVVNSEAVKELNNSENEAEFALRALDNLVRRLAASPGQRAIVLVSPGFLTLTAQSRVSGIVDRALRANVVINTLDARGLYAALPLGDASKSPVLPTRYAHLVGKKAQLSLDRMTIATEVLRNLAYDTGGTFFHNSNDLDEGFRRVGSLPEVYYVLAFSPQNLKLDGRFHRLKVSLSTPQKYSVQARSGYFAPPKIADPASQAKEEIEQAIFSHDEMSELAVAINTQFFKMSDTEAKLSVLTHLDMRLLPFRKENGRNLNNLTFVTVLFDRDGKYMTGKEKLVEFHLLDANLEKLQQSGITSKTTFDVPPGTYLIRQVVRDSEGAQLTALNRTVEIPF